MDAKHANTLVKKAGLKIVGAIVTNVKMYRNKPVDKVQKFKAQGTLKACEKLSKHLNVKKGYTSTIDRLHGKYTIWVNKM